MVFREYFLILLVAHIIGDFYFQSQHMADKKEKSIVWVFVHGICYWGAVFLVSLPVMSADIIIIGVIIAALHLLTDVLKFYYVPFIGKKSGISAHLKCSIFCWDQTIHLLCLVCAAYLYAFRGGTLIISSVFEEILLVTGVSGHSLVSWCAGLLIVHKPANILISRILIPHKPDNKDLGRNKDSNAGRMIGTVERLIMLMFISIGQYAAIGLVLTAKSIARYDKIVKEPEFAEYYLLGTLLSTLIVVVTSVFLL